VAVPAVLLFSTLTLAVTLLHADRFHFHSPRLVTRAGTWVWLLIYAGVPVAMSWLLVAQQRRKTRRDRGPVPTFDDHLA
jgi:hypothetical protein